MSIRCNEKDCTKWSFSGGKCRAHMLAGASAAPSAQAKPDAKAATFEKIDQTFQGRPMKTNPTFDDYVAAGCWMNDRCCCMYCSRQRNG
jgi:hypothetical protein